MRHLGVRTLIVTNASGAINTDFAPGRFYLISDHMNLTGANPLLHPADDRIERSGLAVSCPDMTYAYSSALREAFRQAAKGCGIPLAEGVYVGVRGPSFETPAEIRAFRSMGADLVGMSTVCEVIAAAACGMECAGISLVTNMAAGVLDQRISLDDINSMGDGVVFDLHKLMEGAFESL
jgi:purine-nucleoside phosphorylase